VHQSLLGTSPRVDETVTVCVMCNTVSNVNTVSLPALVNPTTPFHRVKTSSELIRELLSVNRIDCFCTYNLVSITAPLQSQYNPNATLI